MQMTEAEITAAYDKFRAWMKAERDITSFTPLEAFRAGVHAAQLAAPVAAQEPAWLPIASAPMHKEVIVWREDSGAFLARKIAYCDVEGCDSDSDEPAWLADQYGWQEGSETPTHWMPKPADPVASQPAQGDEIDVDEHKAWLTRNVKRAQPAQGERQPQRNLLECLICGADRTKENCRNPDFKCGIQGYAGLRDPTRP
jgi:hypothetical protein